MQGKDHNIILGIIFLIEFIIYGLLSIMIVVLYVAQIGVILTNSPDGQSTAFVLGIFVLVLVLFSIIAVPLGVSSWKLLKNKPNARIWGVIASIISLPLLIPIGLAVGIYGLWFFFSETGKLYYQSIKPNGYKPL